MISNLDIRDQEREENHPGLKKTLGEKGGDSHGKILPRSDSIRNETEPVEDPRMINVKNEDLSGEINLLLKAEERNLPL